MLVLCCDRATAQHARRRPRTRLTSPRSRTRALDTQLEVPSTPWYSRRTIHPHLRRTSRASRASRQILLAARRQCEARKRAHEQVCTQATGVPGCRWLYVSWCCAVSLWCCTETEFKLQVVVSCTALFQFADPLATLLRSAGHLGAVIGRLARKTIRGLSCTKTELMLAAIHWMSKNMVRRDYSAGFD